MPKDLEPDEPQDMDAASSPATELDEKADAATAADAETADSSAATDETEAGTLSVVRDVVEAREEEPAEAASSAEGEDNNGADEQAGEQDDDNFTDVPFNSHPRFRKLLEQRNTFKADAVRYQNVETFLDENNLTSNEAADLMQIAGLAKTNPVAAWAKPATKKWVQDLLVAAGEVLSPELAQRVANKELSQEAALEISRGQAALRSANATKEFQTQRSQRQEQTRQGTLLRDTAEQWVTQRRLRDPNFAAKEDRLKERIAFEQRTEGVPNTADGVKAQLKKAYDYVNKTFAAPSAARPAKAPVRLQPKPAIRPVQGGQVAANSQQPKPKDTMDVIRQVRAARSA